MVSQTNTHSRLLESFHTQTQWKTIIQVSVYHKVISDLVTRQMHAYYVAAHRLFKLRTYKIWQTLSKMMYTRSTQVKNKRIETVICSKSTAIKPEIHCKITSTYKCCWHWTNLFLVNKQCQIQKNRINDLFKVANTP